MSYTADRSKQKIKPEYQDWIEKYVAAHPGNAILSTCEAATTAMQKAFPELRKVRGSVFIAPACLDRHHWWLVDGEENIVDPTASQFQLPYFGNSYIVNYNGLDESKPWTIPQGKCINCGSWSYPPYPDWTCSNVCMKSYDKYLNGRETLTDKDFVSRTDPHLAAVDIDEWLTNEEREYYLSNSELGRFLRGLLFS